MLKRLFLILNLVFACYANAQYKPLENDPVFEFKMSSFKVHSISPIEWLNASLFSVTQKELSVNTTFRIDEEVPYTNSNKPLIKDLYFFDVNLSYSFKNIDISLTLENVLNFADRSFEIESDYIDDLSTLTVFTQQPNTLLNMNLTYRF